MTFIMYAIVQYLYYIKFVKQCNQGQWYWLRSIWKAKIWNSIPSALRRRGL